MELHCEDCKKIREFTLVEEYKEGSAKRWRWVTIRKCVVCGWHKRYKGGWKTK